MKTRFTWLGIIAAIIAGVGLFFAGCNGDVNSIVLYHGQVVYINTTTPFADLTVKVTDGQNTHCQTQTDAGGLFSLKVRVDEIDGSYYLLAGDSTCVPKKVALGGFGQAEVDLGVIEVEGPSLPTVVTTPIQSVTADAATLGGEVQADGRLAITARGVCYGTNQQPTIDGMHTTDGVGKGVFTSNLKDLEHNTIYYARAYATNRMGTAYGEQVKFTTEQGVPIVITDSVIRITAHTAKCKGHVESDGGYAVSKRGTCWSKRPDPTVDDDCTDDGSGIGEFTSTMKDLQESTTYYIRTYATNNTSTVYGEQIIITTLDGLAVVQIDSITAVTATGFTAYGTVVSDCDIPVTARGFCYSTSQYPTIEDNIVTIGKGLGSYQGNVRNLQIGTTYYVRAFATNETGTTYSKQISVTTKDGLPVVETKQANSTATTIHIEGEVTETWGYTVSERGFAYSQQNSEPTAEDMKIQSGKGKGVFSSTIIDLQSETEYFVRAYAINENGTSYGEVIKIATKDGKAVVTIGEVSDTTAITASVSIKVTDLSGASELKESGVCWSTLPNPTIDDSTTIAAGKQLNNEYVCYLSNLQPYTTYYVRAYATTNITTAYSKQQKMFTTKDGLPIVTTNELGEDITQSTILSGGHVIYDGGFAIVDRGVCWSTYPNPTINDNKTSDGTGLGYYSSIITGINLKTATYYIRAFATNEVGTVYGEEYVIEQNNPFHLPTFQYSGYTYCVYYDLGEMNWAAANSACNNLVYVFDDWYLPSYEEMKAMMKSGIINTTLKYWTSSGRCTTCWSGTGGADIIYKDYYGSYYADSKPAGNSFHVRPVRKYLANQ